MNNKVGIILAVVVLVVAAWFGWKMMTPKVQMEAEKTTPAPEQKETADAMAAGEVREIAVKGSPFKFEPSNITVKKGEKVKIVFTNEKGSHDWRLDEFKAATQVLDQGATESVEFVADKTGTFEYYCGVGTHRAMGMKGSFIVE